MVKTKARLARRELRRVMQKLRYRASPNNLPILFANSFPKSGTHLLTQIMQGFTQLGPAVMSGLPPIVMFDGPSGQPRPVNDILEELNRLRQGDIAYGHLHATQEILSALCRPGSAAYFILRDPRDVVLSHVHYVTNMEPAHVHHIYYREVLRDFDQRLRTSILGRPELDVPFPDICARFEPYLGWLAQPEVLVLRFEALINNRETALERILDHAVRHGFPANIPRQKAIRILASGIDPGRSPTFRSGKVGEWQEKFTEAHKQLFKKVAGDLLMKLGYEKDLDW